MRKRLLTMLVLLVAVVTGAWAAADKLYLVVDGTSATLKYGTRGTNDPYYSSDGFGSWTNAVSVKATATTITVDATCKNYQGTSLGSLFKEFTALTVINNLENLNTANTTNISSMFDGCSSLTTLDLSSFNTAKVTQLQVMFNGCSSLTTLDLSSFNTASVTNMNKMFYDCSSLESIYVGDGWNTDNVTSSSGMFYGCAKLPNYNSGKIDKENAHTGKGGYLKVKAKTYKVTLQEGTEDADKWTIPAEAEEGATVTATYSGTRKVKSVKAVKKATSLIVNPVVGQIIGSDGKNYDANATLPDGVTKVAKIFYVGSDNGEAAPYNHGLALALEDVSDTKAWCSQTDATCLGTQYVYDGNSNTEFNDLAGIANTDALVNHTGHTHDAASAARDYNSGTHPIGTSTWFLPSAGQWDKMAHAVGGYANLITNADLKGGDFSTYWSSTECDAQHAWFFFPEYGGWNLNNKGGGNLVRACLAF